MSDKEILKKAMEKTGIFSKDHIESMPDHIPNNNNYYFIIFDHIFAKAFFGSGQKEYFWDGKSGFSITMVAWKWHLQQMVLEENPLKYLSKFL